MRVLRRHGAAVRSGGDPAARGALFELSALHDRMCGYAEDQASDDWDEFWVTEGDLTVFRAHIERFRGSPAGLAVTTLPALDALACDLAAVVSRTA